MGPVLKVLNDLAAGVPRQRRVRPDAHRRRTHRPGPGPGRLPQRDANTCRAGTPLRGPPGVQGRSRNPVPDRRQPSASETTTGCRSADEPESPRPHALAVPAPAAPPPPSPERPGLHPPRPDGQRDHLPPQRPHHPQRPRPHDRLPLRAADRHLGQHPLHLAAQPEPANARHSTSTPGQGRTTRRHRRRLPPHRRHRHFPDAVHRSGLRRPAGRGHRHHRRRLGLGRRLSGAAAARADARRTTSTTRSSGPATRAR